jgi:hypothetical protein
MSSCKIIVPAELGMTSQGTAVIGTQEAGVLLSLSHLSFFFGSTGILTQSLHLEPLHHPYFWKGFFEIVSCELFAQVGFEL